jgi:hypothetical protein
MNEFRMMNRNFIGRRRLLAGAAGAGLALLQATRTSLGQSERQAVVAVDAEAPGRPIAPDFIGLSYESAILAGGDYFTADNESLLGLSRLLGANGVIRIGGNTSERTLWRGAGGTTGSAGFLITPASIDHLAGALRRLGWKLIYGLNLARGTPEQAAAEAAYVAAAVGANLLAFQIGNEPDGFGRWTGVRPDGYDAAAFMAEWRRFHAAIRTTLPDARFAGPDVAGETDWVGAFAEQRPQGLTLLTHHYYADGPAGAPHVSLAAVLRSDPSLGRVLDRLARYGRAYSLPYRLVEANSIYNEGQAGVSDTLAAALWGLELLFEAATAGAAGVNFHAGVHNFRPELDKAYTPIARSGNGRYRPAPLFYGMLAFAVIGRGALVPVRVAQPLADVKAFAARSPPRSLHVCLINKALAGGARVIIDPGRRFSTASLLRLVGPAGDARTGITLGGASVDEFGTWTPIPESQPVSSAGEIAVDVPPASAALISMQG